MPASTAEVNMSRISALFPALLLASLPAAALAGPAENKAVASRVLLEKMGQGRFDIQPELYGPGFVAHGFGRNYTLAEDEASARQLRAAFPDLVVKVDRIIAEGDMVALHWSSSGTNTVAVPGFPGQGKRANVDGMSFFRFADGKIVEEWSTYDNLTILKQLGLIPAK
jgi:steroid delta-isomerase-like uncharacterized protein